MALKGKIIKLYKKEAPGMHHIIMPMFKVKLDDGKIIEVARGKVSVQSFGDDYMNLSAEETKKFNDKPHFGLKPGQKIFISEQIDWD